jgi:hypothetical protein
VDDVFGLVTNGRSPCRPPHVFGFPLPSDGFPGQPVLLPLALRTRPRTRRAVGGFEEMDTTAEILTIEDLRRNNLSDTKISGAGSLPGRRVHYTHFKMASALPFDARGMDELPDVGMGVWICRRDAIETKVKSVGAVVGISKTLVPGFRALRQGRAYLPCGPPTSPVQGDALLSNRCGGTLRTGVITAQIVSTRR